MVYYIHTHMRSASAGSRRKISARCITSHPTARLLPARCLHVGTGFETICAHSCSGYSLLVLLMFECHASRHTWVTEFSGKLRTGKCAGLQVGKSNRNLELEALQISSLHPRSHWGRYAAFPDVRIFLMIWSSNRHARSANTPIIITFTIIHTLFIL